MFKRSTVFVLLVVAMVFISSFAANMMATANLPSSYDPGLSINDAFKNAKTPLLIEFYSDTCGTCQHVSPIIHDLVGQQYKDRLTLVMLDVEAPENLEVAKIFGVDELPSIYVFDFKRMKKQKISPDAFPTAQTMGSYLDKALLANSQAPLRNPMALMRAKAEKQRAGEREAQSATQAKQAFESRNHGQK